jgi:hypothetical protein
MRSHAFGREDGLVILRERNGGGAGEQDGGKTLHGYS